MKSQVFVAALTLFSSMASAQIQKLGCYSSTTGLTFNSTDTFNSLGYCSKACIKHRAFAMIYKDCYCGDEIPADGDKLPDSSCDTVCPGYDADSCGSKFDNYTNIYLSDGVTNVPKASSSTPKTTTTSAGTDTATSTSSSRPSVVTMNGQTVYVTPSGEAESSKSSSKPNVAGIAAGVVVGVLAILGIAGGAFLFMRRRKRLAIEEEHQRNANIKNFVGKPPMSAGSSSFNDTRLDPVMAQRRMSDGSIADNQDYSRKILKVTNA